MDGSPLAIVLMLTGFALLSVMFWPRLSFTASVMCFVAGVASIVAAISINSRHADTSPVPVSNITTAASVADR